MRQHGILFRAPALFKEVALKLPGQLDAYSSAAADGCWHHCLWAGRQMPVKLCYGYCVAAS